MCDCHPRSKEDMELWKQKVKKEPPSKEEWAFLHDCIERYIAFRIENYKGRRQPLGAC